ncbi:MAG: dimethylargininase [Actinobacteria bacterium]|nr:dimethylargininase [Actinomycetota bacterium]
MPRAVLRGVPDSFASALVMEERPLIDVERARAQHDAYRQMLVSAGYEVTMVDPDEDYPDCPFIEDTAVVLDGVAVVTRPGASQRRGETGPVKDLLANLLPVVELTDPATLDGGDVLRIGNTVFVGKSRRTNDTGIAQFAEIASGDGLRVVAAPVANLLHLKSAVLGLDNETVLIASDCTDPNVFVGLRLIEKPPGERKASALRLHDGSVVVTANTAVTMGLLSAAGFEVDWFDASEFQKADGGLTCLSLLM